MLPQRTKVIVLGFLLLLQIGVQLSNPQVLRVFIDSATGGAPFDQLVQLAGLFILIALAQQALVVSGTYLSQDVGWTATNALRAVVAEHCLNLDMAFHKTRTPGEWIERIDGEQRLPDGASYSTTLRITPIDADEVQAPVRPTT